MKTIQEGSFFEIPVDTGSMIEFSRYQVTKIFPKMVEYKFVSGPGALHNITNRITKKRLARFTA